MTNTPISPKDVAELREPTRVMPIQVGGQLDLAERRGERPVLVRSIPWEMVADEATEKQSQKNHGQTVERIAERGGYGAGEAIRVIAGVDLFDDELRLPEKHAHRILYAMRVMFNRGQRVAEARLASQSLEREGDRRAAIEECAKVAERWAEGIETACMNGNENDVKLLRRMAGYIRDRALAQQPPDGEVKPCRGL